MHVYCEADNIIIYTGVKETRPWELFFVIYVTQTIM